MIYFFFSSVAQNGKSVSFYFFVLTTPDFNQLNIYYFPRTKTINFLIIKIIMDEE